MRVRFIGMRYVPFPGSSAEPGGGSGVPLSVLGFGCAPLLGRASRKQSQQAVGAALDAGINFFDVARSYGYGEAESLLGSMFAGRRDKQVLCTKFGILPAAPGGWRNRLKPLVRGALKVFPALRGAVQKQAAREVLPGQFDVPTLTASLEASLRALRTDYIDILLMHAAPASALAREDLMEALLRLVESGKIRLAGISGEQQVIAGFLTAPPRPLATAQFALNMATMAFTQQTRNHAPMLLVANHPFGGPAGDAADRLAALRTAVSPALRELMDPADVQVLPEVVLNCILDGTGVSAVIPTMIEPKHIAGNVQAIASCRFSPAQLAELRAAMQTLA